MDEVTIWFDESGFTGDDLVNRDQRHFVLASSLVGDEEAASILRGCFPRYAGREFKFASLWRGTRNREGLLRFSATLPLLADRTFLYIIDKRSSLIIKLIDYLIEPLAWQSGRDFYRDGYSRRFVNTVHADLLRHGGDDLYDATATAWNRLARSPTPETLAALRAFLASQAAHRRPPLSSFFDLARTGVDDFLSPGERVEDFRDSNDLQVTAMLSSVSHWRAMRDQPFALVHDESASFARRRSMWEALIRGDVEPFQALAASGSVSFPLGVSSSRAERSERSPAIQLCDVLAGSFSRAARVLSGDLDPFLVELMAAGLGDATFDGVMPQRERVQGPAPPRAGPDLLDRMVDVLRPAIDDELRAREARQRP